MIELFVGDCTEYLKDIAKEHDPRAVLIEFSNYEKFLNSEESIVGYTSLADLPKISNTRCVFFEVLNKADRIYYRPPSQWSDHNEDFTLQNQQQLTEYFLYLLDRDKHNVDGLNLGCYINNPYINLQSVRTLEIPQLWVAGCSITAGAGLRPDQKYATKISQRFNNIFSDLSKPGSSLEFAADQILRSDIRPGDVVVWGLTSEYRAIYWDRKTQQALSINSQTFNYKKTNRADDITDETRLYKSVVLFEQVDNFCKKIGAKLVAVPIICSEALQLRLHHYSTYYQLPYQPAPIDFGPDHLHPGPQQHQLYADYINEILDRTL